MLSRNNNKIIYINLEHEKFFFPGEMIKGRMETDASIFSLSYRIYIQ
jgi:hypothetical protein